MLRSAIKCLPKLLLPRPITLAKPSIVYTFTKEQHKDKNEHKNEHKHEREHEHGPNCSHQHEEKKAETTHEQKHQHVHGPNCKHEHPTQVNFKAMTVEQLVEINTEESWAFADKKLAEMEAKNKSNSEEIDLLKKDMDFFAKATRENIDKFVKLEQIFLMKEAEIALSKKRAEKEVEESKNYAVTKIAKELLEVADCVSSCMTFAYRLLEENPEDKFSKQIVESSQVMKEFLKKHEIEEFNPMGQAYDPNTQESLLEIPCPPGYVENNVGVVMRTGYIIKGRLLRSARVGIFR